MNIKWREMLHSAVLAGISPDEFWNIPVRDWLTLTHSHRAFAPLTRRELKNLLQETPAHQQN